MSVCLFVDTVCALFMYYIVTGVLLFSVVIIMIHVVIV